VNKLAYDADFRQELWIRTEQLIKIRQEEKLDKILNTQSNSNSPLNATLT